MKARKFLFGKPGEEIIEVASQKLTGFIPASVPVEVIELWRRRLASQIARRIGRLRHAERRWKRRRLTPVRVARRVRGVKKQNAGPMRRWNPVPRR